MPDCTAHAAPAVARTWLQEEPEHGSGWWYACRGCVDRDDDPSTVWEPLDEPTEDLTRRLAAVRAALAPQPDQELADRCESARRLLDDDYRRAAEKRERIEDEIARGLRDPWTGLKTETILRQERRGSRFATYACSSCHKIVRGHCIDCGPHADRHPIA